MSDNFTFHGETSFINKPKDTVIRDFQNTYITGDGSQNDHINQEVKRLIEIILNSRNLPDDDKENIAKALHNLADQIKSEKANSLTLKGTLDAIKDVVSKAADIASPAIAIIASILDILKNKSA